MNWGTAVWARLETLLDNHDGDFKVDFASESCWAAELRLTIADEKGVPAESIVFYKVAGGTPEEVASAVLDACTAWLRKQSPGPRPMTPDEIRRLTDTS